MLALWPIISLLFVSRRDPAKALTIISVGGYLLLPTRTAFDAPGLPAIGKDEIIALSAFLALGLRKPPDFHWLPKPVLFKTLYILYFIGPIFTVLANADPLGYGPRVIRGLELYDVLGVIFARLSDLIPFSLAMNYLKTRQAQITFLKWLVILGLAYSVLVLFEIRISPQLHAWIYGFFPHSFGQQMRGGGFRAVVFLGHGLLVSFFMFTVFAAAVGLWRAKIKILPVPTAAIVAYLFTVLVLNKSLGSLLYGIFFFAVCVFLPTKRQLQCAAVLAAITLTYPILRGADLVPTDTLVSWAQSISEDRAQSLKFRFDNEDILLEKAEARPVFGWGTWGRNRVYSADTGEDISVTDGTWVIAIGTFGWVGYLAAFGLLFAGPIFLLPGYRVANSATIIAANVSFLLAINGIELLPNSSFSTLTLIMSGTLVGCINRIEV